MPPGETVELIANAVLHHSSLRVPRVPFLNRFCYAIKREVIGRIGYLDEEAFPDGYGEENDYSIRAAQAGFELAIAEGLKTASRYSVRSAAMSELTVFRDALLRGGARGIDTILPASLFSPAANER